MGKRTDLLRGTLDLLVLKALCLEPLHGVGISRIPPCEGFTRIAIGVDSLPVGKCRIQML
jgi:hypothetical protein